MIVAQEVRVSPVGGRGCGEGGNDGGSCRSVNLEDIRVVLLSRSLWKDWDGCQWDVCARWEGMWRGIAGGASAATTGMSTLSCAGSPVAPAGARARASCSAIMGLVQGILVIGVQSPIGAFARLAWWSGHAHKSLVQGQIVANRVLPAIDGSSIPRVALHDPFVNLIKSHLLLRIFQDGGGDEERVRVGGLGVL